MTLAILVVAVFSLFVGVQPATADSPRAYVSDYYSAAVLVIDTSTNAVVARVPVGSTPWGVAITPDGAFAYVANGGGTVSVIETATNTVAATVSLDPHPTGVAITPDGAFAYVTVEGQNEGQNTVAVISTATNTVLKTIDVGPGFPLAVAITPDGAFAYVTVPFQDTVVVISTATNAVVATVPVGSGPLGLAITPDGALVYVALSNGPGGVAVIATETNSVVATVDVGNGQGDVAITPDGAHAYVGIGSAVAVIATATNTVVATVGLGFNVAGIAITHPDGAFAYVAQFSPSGLGSTVNVISTATHTVVDVIDAGVFPRGVAITPSAPRVFMTSPAAGATVNGTVWTDVWVENFVGTSNAFTLTVGGTVVAEATATNHATLAWDSRSIPNGRITLTATVRDAAGVVGATTRRLVVGNGVFITSPRAGTTVGGVVWSDIWVEGAAAGPRTFTLSIGGTTLATASSSGNHVTMAWDSLRVDNGFQAIVATVQDTTGLVGTATRGLIVLNGPAPGVFITSPPAGATVGGIVWSDIWVEGAATGPRTFTLSIGGTTLATASSSGNHVTLPWDSLRVANGAQAIVATVRDAAGHIGVGTRTVNVQNGLLAGPRGAPR